ncbi:MAG TPA: TonB family protein [Candidatus Rubrimentiphilum sp.]|nr:TonB family protein [Candidatus Rubrimentiphilum sp.]
MLTAILLAGFLTAPSSCDQPAMVVDQVSPEFPESVREMGVHPLLKTVQIWVYLDAKGKVSHTEVKQSSGILDLDSAALFAARISTHQPHIVNCRAIPGRYLFKVTFSGN